MKKENERAKFKQFAFAAAAIVILSIIGSLEVEAQTTPARSIGERYGTREPRTCSNMKLPAKGAITAALAERYFICASEKLEGQYLYLVENVKVEVGAGRPYNRNMDINVPDIDVRFPLYAIRGSHTQYQCKDPKTDYIRIEGRTCARYEHKQAKGFCYKTTFGDWRCYQTELFMPNENIFPDVPPPGKNVRADTKDAVPPAGSQSTKQVEGRADKVGADRDEGGFVKPDFSEMEKYFDNIRYEYDLRTRDMNLVGTMKKANNPNKWSIEFFDADGARLKWGNTILHSSSGPDPQIGQVVKMYAGTPTEKQMRDEVKKIVVKRLLD